MAGVRIVTDSACDLPEDVVAEHDIEIVPLTIRFGDTEYVDRVELSVEDFYAKLATSEKLPETAAPSPGQFEQTFRKVAGDGADAVVCVTISAALSATMEAAQQAARAVKDEIEVEVVDSAAITAGLGIVVVEAARAAEGGASAGEVAAVARDVSRRHHVIGALDTLENLKKGGRIGGAQAMLGSMLSIKPMLDLSTGVVEEAGKQRTRRKAMAWLRDRAMQLGEVDHLTVCDGGAPDVDEFIEMLAPRYAPDDLRRSPVGAVIGTHGGPRILGLAWVDKE